MYGRITLFISAVCFTALTLVLYAYGMEQSLFWKHTWYDTLLHFLGGISAGLGVMWLLTGIKKHTSLIAVLLGVLCIGIAWEIFEILVGFPREANYAFDTMMDILMDLAGGVIALLFFRYVLRT